MKRGFIDTVAASALHLVFPKFCISCNTGLYLDEKVFCLFCQNDLQFLPSEPFAQKQLQQIFDGRLKVECVFSHYLYIHNNPVQSLLREIKYNGAERLAIEEGRKLGKAIVNNVDVDVIIPLPLHPKKKRKRGYNQAEKISKGLAEILDVEMVAKIAKRKVYNQSQTKFNKYDRWDNVRGIFELSKPSVLENKHVLLVDDVLTTGATLEAFARTFKDIPGIKISIATLAARL